MLCCAMGNLTVDDLRWIWHSMITTAQKWRVIGDDAGIADGYPGSEICYPVPSLVLIQICITVLFVGIICQSGPGADVVSGGRQQTTRWPYVMLYHHGQLWARADSRFAPGQWETALLCNDVSHWLGTSLGSALWVVQHPGVLLLG